MDIRIGSRSSELALWQARKIQTLIHNQDFKSRIIEIESFGDREQDIPIHKLGDKGVFTKALDLALLNNEIDLAVHSLKDVPTILDDPLILASVPEREDPRDVLVRKQTSNTDTEASDIVATGSIRRKAFWLNQFPEGKVIGLRGNVPTRIAKVDQNSWQGGIFALAGLKRLGLENRASDILDWMIPAPSQGALGIICRAGDEKILPVLQKLEDPLIRKCVNAERSFLRTLEAGCSSPVGALAVVNEDHFHFRGAVLSVDGKEKLEISESVATGDYTDAWGEELARKLIEQGALELMKLGG